MLVPRIRIGRLPCIMMLVMSAGLFNHVIIAPLLLQMAGRDSWLAILICAALLPLWLLLIHAITRSMGSKPLPDWLHERAGRTSSALFLSISIVFLFLVALITAVDTATWGSSTYLPNTPKLLTALIFVGVCVAGSVIGLHVIAYMSCVLLPLVVVLGCFVATANIPRKDYAELLPLLENGWTPVLQGMVIVGGGFAELLLFTALSGYVDRPFKRMHLIGTGLFLSLLCFGPVVGVIAEFGPAEAMAQRYPAFAQWRLVQIGKYIEHVDFFAIYQWLSGAFVRTSAALCLIVDFLSIRSRLKRIVVNGTIGLAIAIVAVLPIGDAREYRFFTYYMPVSFYVLMLLFVYQLLIAAFSRKEGKADARNGI